MEWKFEYWINWIYWNKFKYMNESWIYELNLNIWNKFKYMEWKFECIEYKFEYIEYKFEYMNICNSEWLLSIKEETSIGCNANMFGDSRDCWNTVFSSQPDFISMQTFEHLHAITNIQTVMLNAH